MTSLDLAEGWWVAPYEILLNRHDVVLDPRLTPGSVWKTGRTLLMHPLTLIEITSKTLDERCARVVEWIGQRAAEMAAAANARMERRWPAM